MKDSIGSVADESCPQRDVLKLWFDPPESRRLHMTAYGSRTGYLSRFSELPLQATRRPSL
jgi:hypothetical protein